MIKSNLNLNLVNLISIYLFFKVPNNGIDIKSLIPIINN